MTLTVELRSAAATLCTPTGSLLPAQDRITAELIERAADALQKAARTWFKPSERLPEKSGARVMVHVVMEAGSKYAVLTGEKRGWQAIEVATFHRRLDGSHVWDMRTAGEVVAWAEIDKSEVEQRKEPWL